GSGWKGHARQHRGHDSIGPGYPPHAGTARPSISAVWILRTRLTKTADVVLFVRPIEEQCTRMASLWCRFRPWLTIRIRSLLVLIAIVAMAFGVYLELARREERRRQLPYDILHAADAGDVPRILRLLDEGANVDSVTDGRFPWTPLMKAACRGRTDAVR